VWSSEVKHLSMLLGSSLVYTHAHNCLIHDPKGIALPPKKPTKTILSLFCHSHIFWNLYGLFSSSNSKGFTSFNSSWSTHDSTFVLHCFFFLFYSNRITRDGAKCLSDVLKQSCSLEILDLSSNRIEDDGVVYLSEAIKLPHSKLKA